MLSISSRKFIFLAFICSLFIACASNQPQSLRKVSVGMDKSDVLDLAGNPTRKARVLGQDRWTYEVTSSGAQAETTYIFFQDGKVTHVGETDSAPKDDSKFKPVGD